MNKNAGFIKGAIVLAVGGILAKVIGVLFRIPLTNITGAYGMGIYQMVFPIYALLLVISQSGFPTAIARRVAIEPQNAKKTLRASLLVLGMIGFLVSGLFVLFAYPLATAQGLRAAGLVYYGIAPSVLLVCLISAFRGYFQGLNNFMPTALSQIIEQIVKVGVGIFLAAVFMKHGVVIAILGAMIGVSASELLALLYLVITFAVAKKVKPDAAIYNNDAHIILDPLNFAMDTAEELAPTKTNKEDSLFKLGFSIFRQSIPITLSAIIFPLLLVIDSVMVVNLLMAKGMAGAEATSQYGIVSGVVGSLINLPTIVAVALAASVVPAIAGMIKNNAGKSAIAGRVKLAVKVVVSVMIFAASVFMVFPTQVIALLYSGGITDAAQIKLASELLALGSALVITISLTQVFSSVCFAYGKNKWPLMALAIGGLVKIAVQWIGLQHFGVIAVIGANAACYLVALGILGLVIMKQLGKDFNMWGFTVVSVILNFVFVGVCYLVLLILPKGSVVFISALALLALIYVGLIFAFKILKPSDLKGLMKKK